MKREPREPLPECDHAARAEPAPAALERAARLFRAMGDGPRLRLLDLLGRREWCVGELAATVGEKLPAVSQRLKLLRLEGLVGRRRDGNHVYYRLADRHVAGLLRNALAHASEPESGAAHASDEARRGPMSEPHHHGDHAHQHGPACGHKGVKHGDHVDYLHDGHLHHPTAGGVEEHVLPVTGTNPAGCTPAHACAGHAKGHVHGPGCGHEAVPHGDHVDYLVDGHLHHPHGDHCDDHGPVEVI